MHPVPILFGIGCMVTAWFATQSRDYDVRAVAAYLAVMWAGMNALWFADLMVIFPVFDWFCGVMAVFLWWTRRARWVALVAQIATARLVLHVLYSLTGDAFTVPYIHALNATFAGMLVTVAYPGGGNARRTLLRGLRRLGGVVSSRSSKGLSHGG